MLKTGRSQVRFLRLSLEFFSDILLDGLFPKTEIPYMRDASSRSSHNFYSPYIQENAGGGAFTHTYEVPVEVGLESVELDVNVLKMC